MKRAFCFIVIVCQFGISFAADVQIFTDLTPQDPMWESVVEYSNRGIFEGIPTTDGKKLAKPNDVILKKHAAVFLAKVLGVSNPTMEDIVAMKLLSAPPKDDEILNHATWIKMCSTAFKVPVGESPSPETWFVAPFIIAQSIGAVKDEKPFDFATRRFALKTAFLYEQVFGVKNSDEIMNNQEKNLMKIRDKLIDINSEDEEIEDLIWENIFKAEEVPANARIQAIKHLNMASLVLLELRKNTETTKKTIFKKRVKFFCDKATEAFPDVEPFSLDLEKISER
jgi:hypothetical protein